MKKIGLLVAVEEEALLRKFGAGVDLKDGFGTVLYQIARCQLYAVHSGAGEIYAASSTQHLIDRYGVDALFNYGIVGACSAELPAGEICVVDRVVHYQYDTSAIDNVPVGRYLKYPHRWLETDKRLVRKAVEAVPELRSVLCASGDKFVADPNEKQYLHDAFGASICDMEAAAIVLTCDRNQIPCLLIKTVSDSVTGGAEEYRQEKNRTASACLDAMIQVIETI